MRNHRGFTLIELMIVLILMVSVAGSIYKLLNTTQRLSRAQAERLDLQSNVRTASLLVPNELRELNTFGAGSAADRNDITGATQTSITYRAMRSLGFICETGTTTLRVRRSTWSGYRDPVAVQDGAYVFVQAAQSKDDIWSPQTIASVSTATNCPGGVPAITLSILPGVANPPIGTPVRTYELMELKAYQTAGKWWLGAKSVNIVGSTTQPLLGPLRGSDGVDLRYLNAAGVETATLADIKSITFKVWGVTNQNISTGGGNATTAYVQDSLVTQVSMRNAFRP